ncbi:GNAT family N-acetyltransferase [Bradyrhizobium sp. LHD-71]|uniref:GNAT family N-acetyltransferase n=1 Tax=Bradyrhizobium sp. LHD-71 TaxID=3072141 RepID=UPI00280F4A7D|nr:GNAT family N-acetyltransferase [Bradyrhizobium sp. LHD-71]MDQ8726829.1 GNAT family N-acetyltransferase [Bradyrhizobium sp. LHD-71]
MALREARREDVREIVEMLLDDDLGKTREDLSDLSPYLKGFDAVAADPLNTQYVWEEDGELLGCLQLTIIPGIGQRGLWRAQIEGVRVKGLRRGTGVGHKMMAAVVAIARERGCGQMQLTTNKVRTDAQRFYEALGFEKSHEGMKLKL